MNRAASTRRAVRARVAAGALALPCLLAACAAGQAPRPPSLSAGSAPLPGLTDGSVVVGYALADGGAFTAASEDDRADDSDPIVQARVVRAYVDYVNRAGGAGGRRLEAELAEYPGVTASPEQAQALCGTFTQDKKVFAAVLDGQDDQDALSCYANANTLVLDESLVGHDTAQFEEFAPYLWSPTHPELSSFVATQLREMRSDGFFDGVDAVQVLQAATDPARRTTDDVVQPFLQSIGVTRTEVSTVDITRTTALVETTSAALAVGVAGGFERVVIVGGGPIVSTALADEGADYYASTWGVSTFDAPGALTSNPGRIVASRLVATSGFGYAPAYDVDASRGGPFPDPERPAEAVCKGILDAAGITLGDGERPDYRSAFQFCDATLFLKAALDRVPPGTTLTGDVFAAAVGRVGTRYSSSLTFGSSLEPGQYAATNAGRVLTADASCACFTYKGDHVPISAN